jgi:hypothetical protein
MQQELPFLAGMQNDIATLEDGFLQIWHTVIIWPLVFTQRSKCPPKMLHTNVYETFTHDCQNLEATKMSFSRIGKKAVILSLSGILFTVKNKWAISLQKDTGKT